jgi:hypothetical protein
LPSNFDSSDVQTLIEQHEFLPSTEIHQSLANQYLFEEISIPNQDFRQRNSFISSIQHQLHIDGFQQSFCFLFLEKVHKQTPEQAYFSSINEGPRILLFYLSTI